MPGRALLIGGAVGKLTGVDNDIAAMTDALVNRGIAVEPEFVLSGKDATRKAILAAYERLIDLTEFGDLAVVYYSGHGGRALPPTSLAAQPAPAPGTAADTDSGPGALDLQFIVPYDYNESAPGDFRGITSVELSVLQARLTQKTDNVVTIFDCCHSGHISREQFVPRGLKDHVTSYEELSSHIERMERAGMRAKLFRALGNPNAVRIVACAPEQESFEYPGVGGQQIGLMTEALTIGLRMAGKEKVSWATLLDGMRYRIAALIAGQRPEAEGPSRRLLFEAKEDDHLGSLPVVDLGNGRLQLNCAPLLGVRPGDTFSIVSSSEEKIGDLTVDKAGPLFAQGPVTLAAGVAKLPLGARAVRLTASAPKLVVSVLPDVQPSPQLARALKESPLVRLADPDDPDDLWAAQLRIDENGGVTIADRNGALQNPPTVRSDPARTVDNLERLARAEALRRLDNNSDWALRAKVTVEWGLVEEGQRRPLPKAGAVVRAGQEVYVSVRTQNDDPVYVTLVDIGVNGAVTVLTDFAPPGVRLSRDDRQEYVFGYEELTRTLDGVPLEWPEGLAPGQARTETVLVFVTAEPQDFSALVQQGVKRRPGAPVSPLTAVIDQLAAGGGRNLPRARRIGGRYDVRKIEFELEPASEGFLIEEKSLPQPSGALPRCSVTVLVEPGAGVPAPVGDVPVAVADIPTAVAVRLEELVVHRNRARFGGADIRVDAIVLTGTQDSPKPTFRAQTQRFSRIRDGEPLPLDRMLVFHGPVVDYLDIALWVSRDGHASRDLGELLSDEVATFEMQEALAKAGETLTGLPYAAAAAAAVGIGAVVVNLAYRLLRGSVSDVIGLYRGSRLAGEAFGVGRHPGSGTRQVQDFSLAFSIDDVS